MTNNPTPAEKRKATRIRNLMEEYQITLDEAHEMYLQEHHRIGSKGGKSETSFRGFRDVHGLASRAGKKSKGKPGNE